VSSAIASIFMSCVAFTSPILYFPVSSVFASFSFTITLSRFAFDDFSSIAISYSSVSNPFCDVTFTFTIVSPSCFVTVIVSFPTATGLSPSSSLAKISFSVTSILKLSLLSLIS